MNVQQTVCLMMRAVPTLFRTRVMALKNLFDSFDTEWVNGELVSHERPSADRDYLPYAEHEVALPEDLDQVEDISDLLFKRSENAKAQFVHDNAELLSRHTTSHFDLEHAIHFSGRRLMDIPDDVSDDWLAAAKELANAIMHHKLQPKPGYTEAYAAAQQRQQDESARVARQFLERFNVIKPCPYARAARVKELLQEAQALGMHLTESDGSTPKTTV